MAVATVDRETIRRILREELPRMVEEDQDFRYWLTGWIAETFPKRSEVEQALAQVLEHLVALREDFNRQFALQSQRLEVVEQRLEVVEQRLEVVEQRLEVVEQRLDAFEQRMEELRQDFNRQMMRLVERHESLEQRVNQGFARLEATVGAIGARWGMMAEEAFRSGMAGILRDQFGWQVERLLMMDTEGFVFGHPDQVEIDIAIHDGAHWLIEIRSSMSKAEMYTFVRKVEFYERLRGVQVARRIVISPMIHPQAQKVAERLGIELYTSVYDVSPDLRGG
ncbi:MAG: PD-(D/E)XK nuclease family protein [Anaerolineae bacterium]